MVRKTATRKNKKGGTIFDWRQTYCCYDYSGCHKSVTGKCYRDKDHSGKGDKKYFCKDRSVLNNPWYPREESIIKAVNDPVDPKCQQVEMDPLFVDPITGQGGKRKTKKNKRRRSLKKGGDGNGVTYCCTKKSDLENNADNTCALSTTGYCFNKSASDKDGLQKVNCDGYAENQTAHSYTIRDLMKDRNCKSEDLTPKLWRPWEGGKRRTKKNKSKRSKK
jgi:hypothetical protein